MEGVSASVTDTASYVVTLVATYGLSAIGGIVILIVGWIVAGWASGTAVKLMRRTGKVDTTLERFFASLVKYLILAFTVIAVLSQFGVQTASLIAVFGATGLAIGLALQGTLSHVASGVMLLLFRPFKVGDFVEAGGHAGTVQGITLFVTELATPDNVQILIPNGQVWGSSVTNFSFHPTRRLDFLVGIDYADDIDKAIRTVREVIAADSRCHKEPEAMAVVSELADSSVNLTVRVWCDAGDYWPLKFDLTKKFKEALDAAAISIPFPQRTVHLFKAD